MTYQATIDYLFTKLPAYQRVGKSAFKKDLTNIIALCEHLGHPHKKIKSIHIAGTNGKGSTAHILASIFQEAGYKTGLYTSPHLIDFRERIKLNGEYISKQAIIGFVKKIQPLIDKIKPSFFEITVAMAFYTFARKNVDIAIIETGLGGRLDSTNIIQPLMSLITNIGLDHQQFLGETIKEIAFEKAGIIKATTPVIIGDRNKTTAKIFKKKAKAEKAPLTFAEDELCIEKFELTANYAKYSVKELNGKKQVKLKCALKGHYQQKNVLLAIAAVQQLNKLNDEICISDKQLKLGLKHVVSNTKFWGRWQIVQTKPSIVLDCAHNVEGIQSIRKHLKLEQFKQLHIVYGCVGDKDVQSIAQLLPKKAKVYITQPTVQRARPYKSTSKAFKKAGFKVTASDSDISVVLKAAQQNASKNDLILITGSVFLVADVLQIID